MACLVLRVLGAVSSFEFACCLWVWVALLVVVAGVWLCGTWWFSGVWIGCCCGMLFRGFLLGFRVGVGGFALVGWCVVLGFVCLG